MDDRVKRPLNLTAMDTVIVLLPHEYRQDRLIEPGDILRIPDAEEQAMGIHYRVKPPAGQQQAIEMIKVVGTKEPYIFGQGLPTVSMCTTKCRPGRQLWWS